MLKTITKEPFKHWTEKSITSYKIAFLFHFAVQFEIFLKDNNIHEKDFCKNIGMKHKKFKRLMLCPDKLRLKTIFKLSNAIGCHVGLILYEKEHGEKKHHPGPVCPIFMKQSWMLCEYPVDNFEMEEQLK